MKKLLIVFLFLTTPAIAQPWWDYIPVYSRLVRPPYEQWKAHANAGDKDDVGAYVAAAKKLGIDIRLGYPTPAVAGAQWCYELGMTGIYISRAQVNRSDELTNEFLYQKGRMRE